MSDSAAAQAATPTYDPHWYAPLFAIEDQHFWFRSRNRVIATVVRSVLRRVRGTYRVLEVGCGTGNVLRMLEQICVSGMVVGMDLFTEGLHYARQRSISPLVQGDLHRAPFDTHFDVIGMFDVIEHLPDDLRVLADLQTMLTPGGALILTVPAHPSLWSYFDEASHHYRRYTTADLESKLTGAGYRIEYMTQYMAAIFPVVWIGRRLAEKLSRRGTGEEVAREEMIARELQVKPQLNTLLTALLASEAHLIARRRRIPIGTSLLAVARKDTAR